MTMERRDNDTEGGIIYRIFDCAARSGCSPFPLKICPLYPGACPHAAKMRIVGMAPAMVAVLLTVFALVAPPRPGGAGGAQLRAAGSIMIADDGTRVGGADPRGAYEAALADHVVAIYAWVAGADTSVLLCYEHTGDIMQMAWSDEYPLTNSTRPLVATAPHLASADTTTAEPTVIWAHGQGWRVWPQLAVASGDSALDRR